MNLFKMIPLATLLVSGVAHARDVSKERTLLAYLNIQPGKEAQLLDAARDVIAKSRLEPGNLTYVLNHSIENPHLFVFFERFKSDEDLQAHRKTPHVVTFMKKMDSILAEPITLNELTIEEPQTTQP